MANNLGSIVPIISTPAASESWVEGLYVGKAMEWGQRLLSSPQSGAMDSIRLQLPWGQIRNFLVPAANPQNPTFETLARGFQSQINWGFGVQREFLGKDGFCTVSVRG